ncbi:hypothetical protein BB560_001644 [Smittium megazygosporum]|uniref:Uncharacterized protein n=1 Tax=Smittium megazygosporum TaxID=133381 RepID=A0A2T9ZH24_9FUNG|nr:hypothetical protein BB560_001644 [Smittium megazygosporum]
MDSKYSKSAIQSPDIFGFEAQNKSISSPSGSSNTASPDPQGIRRPDSKYEHSSFLSNPKYSPRSSRHRPSKSTLSGSNEIEANELILKTLNTQRKLLQDRILNNQKSGQSMNSSSKGEEVSYASIETSANLEEILYANQTNKGYQAKSLNNPAASIRAQTPPIPTYHKNTAVLISSKINPNSTPKIPKTRNPSKLIAENPASFASVNSNDIKLTYMQTANAIDKKPKQADISHQTHGSFPIISSQAPTLHSNYYQNSISSAQSINSVPSSTASPNPNVPVRIFEKEYRNKYNPSVLPRSSSTLPSPMDYPAGSETEFKNTNALIYSNKEINQSPEPDNHYANYRSSYRSSNYSADSQLSEPRKPLPNPETYNQTHEARIYSPDYTKAPSDSSFPPTQNASGTNTDLAGMHRNTASPINSEFISNTYSVNDLKAYKRSGGKIKSIQHSIHGSSGKSSETTSPKQESYYNSIARFFESREPKHPASDSISKADSISSQKRSNPNQQSIYELLTNSSANSISKQSSTERLKDSEPAEEKTSSGENSSTTRQQASPSTSVQIPTATTTLHTKSTRAEQCTQGKKTANFQTQVDNLENLPTPQANIQGNQTDASPTLQTNILHKNQTAKSKSTSTDTSTNVQNSSKSLNSTPAVTKVAYPVEKQQKKKKYRNVRIQCALSEKYPDPKLQSTEIKQKDLKISKLEEKILQLQQIHENEIKDLTQEYKTKIKDLEDKVEVQAKASNTKIDELLEMVSYLTSKCENYQEIIEKNGISTEAESESNDGFDLDKSENVLESTEKVYSNTPKVVKRFSTRLSEVHFIENTYKTMISNKEQHGKDIEFFRVINRIENEIDETSTAIENRLHNLIKDVGKFNASAYGAGILGFETQFVVKDLGYSNETFSIAKIGDQSYLQEEKRRSTMFNTTPIRLDIINHSEDEELGVSIGNRRLKSRPSIPRFFTQKPKRHSVVPGGIGNRRLLSDKGPDLDTLSSILKEKPEPQLSFNISDRYPSVSFADEAFDLEKKTAESADEDASTSKTPDDTNPKFGTFPNAQPNSSLKKKYPPLSLKYSVSSSKKQASISSPLSAGERVSSSAPESPRSNLHVGSAPHGILKNNTFPDLSIASISPSLSEVSQDTLITRSTPNSSNSSRESTINANESKNKELSFSSEGKLETLNLVFSKQNDNLVNEPNPANGAQNLKYSKKIDFNNSDKKIGQLNSENDQSLLEQNQSYSLEIAKDENNLYRKSINGKKLYQESNLDGFSQSSDSTGSSTSEKVQADTKEGNSIPSISSNISGFRESSKTISLPMKPSTALKSKPSKEITRSASMTESVNNKQSGSDDLSNPLRPEPKLNKRVSKTNYTPSNEASTLTGEQLLESLKMGFQISLPRQRSSKTVSYSVKSSKPAFIDELIERVTNDVKNAEPLTSSER